VSRYFRRRRGTARFDSILDSIAHRSPAFLLNGPGMVRSARPLKEDDETPAALLFVDSVGHAGPVFKHFRHMRSVVSVGCRQTQLAHMDLSDRDLSYVVLSDADLSRAHLARSDLRNAKLFRANLESADLSLTRLTTCDLRLANLEGARLVGADLSHAFFNGANLRGADLRDTRVRDVDFSGADLTGATLDPTFDAARCRYDGATRWP
jgi:hypothetical protein